MRNNENQRSEKGENGCMRRCTETHERRAVNGESICEGQRVRKKGPTLPPPRMLLLSYSR